jgi:signal transduction histidine kinase
MLDVLAQQILDALPVAVCTVDPDAHITSAAREWARFGAMNGATVIGGEAAHGHSLWTQVGDPGWREQVERAMSLLRANRAPVVRWESPLPSADDERIYLMQVTGLRAADHALTGFVVAAVDITESHRSREALIDTGIALSRTIALDRVYHEVGLQVRRAVPCEALAVAVADDETAAFRVVHSFGFGVPDAALEAELAPVWLDALANGEVTVRHGVSGLEITAPIASAEGVLGAITVRAEGIENAQRLDEAERVLATLAAQTAAAIERAHLVRRVEGKRRLEAIGEVAAGVAHELRNPLFGISSAAQLLRFRIKDDPVVEKNVGRILREVERLNRMVGELLEYGRPAAPRLAVGDPDATWDDVLEANRGLFESRGLALERVRAEPPARVLVDAEQLTQVFTNLLVNAVDAAPEGSDLTLTTCTLPSGAWRSRLTNGGPAIPPESLHRAFEIFFSTKPGGTGIGLALCQRIVGEHGGTIALESEPGTGTTAVVTLPGVGD